MSSTHSATTPNKRRHSEISSMPSSSNQRGRGRAAAATNHGHHPFEGFMSALGFHRSRGDADEKRQGHSAPSSSNDKPAPSSSSRNPKPKPKDERRVHKTKSPEDDTPVDPSSPRAWRTAFCSKSNKPYYWNTVTRESRWKKPIELASSSERAAIERKENEQKEFFKAMERNILARLEVGSPTGESGKKGATADAVVDDEVLPTTGMLCGIDSSWMTSSGGTATPGGDNDDWIAGWVTPTSEASTPSDGSQRTDGSGRDSALMEGYSLMPGLTPGISPADQSYMSLGTLSREERDDRLGPLEWPRAGNGAGSKLERIMSSGSVIDKPTLIRTISKMEFDMAHLRNLNPDLDPGMRLRASAVPRGGTPRLGEGKGRRQGAGDADIR